MGPNHHTSDADHPECLNCGTRLRGQYCGHCGQRARSRLISMWQLTQEAFGDLFELDSRLWRTIIPLLLRPGRLTRDYLEGRRARYMPPFRTYLVLSVIFFVVAFFDPRDDLGLLFEPQAEPPAEQSEAEREEALEDAAAAVRELNVEGVLSDEQAEDVLQEIEQSDGPDVTLFGDDEGGLNVRYDSDSGECIVTGADRLPEWLQRRLTPERLKTTCERIAADEGSYYGELLLDNVPIALILLLPLMALVLKVLYPLSRRYFVEHLLFFIHFHAFFFLVLTLQVLYAGVGHWIGFPEWLVVLPIVAASFYIPVYLYKAMRLVYGQGHLLTLLKYVSLVTAYAFGAMLTMLGAMLVALLAI